MKELQPQEPVEKREAEEPLTRPDGTPDIKAYNRLAWDRHREKHDKLREVANDAIFTLAEAVDRRVENGIELDKATAHHKPCEIPGDLAVTCLPPTVFGPLSGPDVSEIPTTEEEREALVQCYKAYQKEGYKEDASNFAPGDRFMYLPGPAYAEEDLAMILEVFHQDKIFIDEDSWRRYRDAARQQWKDGRYTLEAMTDSRFSSMKLLTDGSYLGRLTETVANWQAESVMVLSMDYYGVAPPSDRLTLPVSEYGKDFTEKLIRIAAYIEDKAYESFFTDKVNEAGEANRELLLKHTTRSYEMKDPQEGLRQTAREGVLSTIQAMAFLTSQKVEGYDSGEELLHDLIKDGLILQFVRAIPAGFIGPISNYGRVCPDIVQTNGTNLELNPDRLRSLKEAKNAQIITLSDTWTAHLENNGEMPDMLGLFCPAIKGIERLSRTIDNML